MPKSGSELDVSSNGTAPFASFFAYLQDLLTKIPFPESVGLEIQEAFEPQNHSWATDLAEPAVFIRGERSRCQLTA